MKTVLDLRQYTETAQRRNVTDLLAVLQGGESFTLLNGSDPKRLLESLDVDAAMSLRLEYLEKGPDIWRLKLTKLAGSGDGEKEGCCGLCGG